MHTPASASPLHSCPACRYILRADGIILIELDSGGTAYNTPFNIEMKGDNCKETPKVPDDKDCVEFMMNPVAKCVHPR
jgi:hypothetical protein